MIASLGDFGMEKIRHRHVEDIEPPMCCTNTKYSVIISVRDEREVSKEKLVKL